MLSTSDSHPWRHTDCFSLHQGMSSIPTSTTLYALRTDRMQDAKFVSLDTLESFS